MTPTPHSELPDRTWHAVLTGCAGGPGLGLLVSVEGVEDMDVMGILGLMAELSRAGAWIDAHLETATD